MQPNLYEKILEICCLSEIGGSILSMQDSQVSAEKIETHMILVRTAMEVFFKSVGDKVITPQQFDALHEILMDIENELADQYRPRMG